MDRPRTTTPAAPVSQLRWPAPSRRRRPDRWTWSWCSPGPVRAGAPACGGTCAGAGLTAVMTQERGGAAPPVGGGSAPPVGAGAAPSSTARTRPCSPLPPLASEAHTSGRATARSCLCGTRSASGSCAPCSRPKSAPGRMPDAGRRPPSPHACAASRRSRWAASTRLGPRPSLTSATTHRPTSTQTRWTRPSSSRCSSSTRSTRSWPARPTRRTPATTCRLSPQTPQQARAPPRRIDSAAVATPVSIVGGTGALGFGLALRLGRAGVPDRDRVARRRAAPRRPPPARPSASRARRSAVARTRTPSRTPRS